VRTLQILPRTRRGDSHRVICDLIRRGLRCGGDEERQGEGRALDPSLALEPSREAFAWACIAVPLLFPETGGFPSPGPERGVWHRSEGQSPEFQPGSPTVSELQVDLADVLDGRKPDLDELIKELANPGRELLPLVPRGWRIFPSGVTIDEGMI